MSDMKDTIAKYFIMWVLAGLIVWAGSLLMTWLSGGFEDIIAELLISAVLESFPFPFNLIVTWHINPMSLVLQTIVFVVLITLIEIMGKRSSI
ncbi:MAG: hypothetical protein OEY81_01405 [Candidatus Bathyarchaeota archaeon]|nr:hypothetical protein [Candidatus Bathyarchaeota archaeon]